MPQRATIMEKGRLYWRVVLGLLGEAGGREIPKEAVY